MLRSPLMRGTNWNCEPESRTTADRRVHAQRPTVHLDNPLCDCETETRAAFLLGRGAVPLVELFENIPLVYFGNSRSRVGNGYMEGAVNGSDLDAYLSAI